EAAIVAEELGRGLADTAFLGPTLAAELRRLADAPTSAASETVVLSSDLGSFADGAIAIDAAGAASALVLVDGARLAQIALAEARAIVDLTRPAAVVDPSIAVA